MEKNKFHLLKMIVLNVKSEIEMTEIRKSSKIIIIRNGKILLQYQNNGHNVKIPICDGKAT